MMNSTSSGTDAHEPKPHYWSMDHYGFDDHPPAVPSGAPVAPRGNPHHPTRARRGPRLVLAAGVAVTALVLAGAGGVAAAQAVGRASDPAGVVQQDVGLFRLAGDDQVDGPSGRFGDGLQRGGGPRGGGR